MSATSDAVMGGVISGVVCGVVTGVLAANAAVNRLKVKVKGDGNVVSQGNSGPTYIYASPEPPKQPDPAPYLLPMRVGNSFLVRNAGGDYAIDPDWTTTAEGGDPSVIPSGTGLPNPMGPGIETKIGFDGATFASGATTIDVTWSDRHGRRYSNRLNV